LPARSRQRANAGIVAAMSTVALRLAGLAALGLIGVSACGNNVTLPSGTGGEGGGGAGSSSSLVPSTSSGLDGGGGSGGLGSIVDPGCEDPPPPIQDFACDPYAQGNGDCAPGEGCFIYVQYPPEPCGQEIYGAFCSPAGPGTQGSPCFGGQDCGAGYVCVVSGSGNQCVALCPLDGSIPCPSGLVCEPIDVEGFGGCI
jgi:hypothetical protein